MRARVYLFLYFFIFVAFAINGRDINVDSLKQALRKTKNDTIRCEILSLLSEYAPGEEWHLYNDTLYSISQKNLKTLTKKSPGYKTYMWYYGLALNNLGYLANQNGNISLAIDYYNKSIIIRTEIDDKAGLAACYNNIGYIYKMQSNIPMATEYYSKGLKIQESILSSNGEPVNKKGLAYSLSNLGVIYKENGDVKKAEEYYNRALRLRKEINDKPGIGHSLNNIGFIYFDAGNLDKALEYFNESLKFREETGDKSAIANSLHNIGNVYEKKGNVSEALKYLEKAVVLQEETDDKHGLSRSLSSLAGIYFKENNTDEAIRHANRAKELALKIENPAYVAHAANILCKIYKAGGNNKSAFENYKLFVQMNDSVTSETNKKAGIKSQLKYDYEKRAYADSVKVAEERKVSAAILVQEKTQRNFLFSGLLLVILFSVFMANRFRLTNKQKKIIEEQKTIVEQQKTIAEQKQKEVLDSIHYAKRIQQSLLPSENYIGKILKGKST